MTVLRVNRIEQLIRRILFDIQRQTLTIISVNAAREIRNVLDSMKLP